MALYGGLTYLNPLSMNDVGTGYLKNESRGRKEGYSSLFRILITIFEIGLSFIPGIGVAGQIAIGLLGFAANFAISYATNSLSAVGIGMDLVGAFAPAYMSFRYASRFAKNVKNGAFLEREEGFINSINTTLKDTTTVQLRKDLARAATYAGRATRTERLAINNAIKLAEKIQNKTLSAVERAAIKIATIDERAAGFARVATQKQRDALINYRAAVKKFAAEERVHERLVEEKIAEWRKLFDDIKNTKISNVLSKSGLVNKIEKIAKGDKDKMKILKQIYLSPVKKTPVITSYGELQSANEMLKLTKPSRQLMTSFLTKVKYTSMTKNEIKTELDMIVESIRLTNPSDFEIMARIDPNDLLSMFSKYGRYGQGTQERNLIKRLGSASFNKNFVQIAQLIDPNDVGRFPVELAYGWLKTRFGRAFEKGSIESLKRKTVKSINNAKNIDEAFVRSGGVLLPFNRYIVGMKVLPGGNMFSNLVLIKFNKLNTGTKKVPEGKRDVIVMMSNEDIRKMTLEGTDYWFRVGLRKGWFLSKGGKSRRQIASTINNELSLFLGFVPIPALRNTLSIISNWVENIGDIAKGDYFDQWLTKFKRAFYRSSINRSSRLLSRVVIGGAYSKYVGNKTRAALEPALKAEMKVIKRMDIADSEISKLITASQSKFNKSVEDAIRRSSWLGRELQRFTTTMLSSFEGIGTAKEGNKGEFTFDINSKNLLKAGKKLYKQALPTSVRSTLLRKANRQGATTGRQIISNRRNIGEIGRIYSAFTPSGVKPLRSLTKIKR